ncbi:MAG: 4Fe-4S binding protein [Bacteroidales bacterium]|nr:4Fe-4S binding protein [Bacteroidales bacterium]
MQDKNQNKDFHHALKVDNDLCFGCTHCMTACPTQAIRVKNGKATIIANRCVDCGQCYIACPVSAIDVEQDDLEMIFKFPVRVILIPSVLIGQFPRKILTSDIYDALKEIGFTHIFEVETSIDMVLDSYKQFMDEHKERPMISTFCPAIVRLIQVKYPSLVGNLLRVNPPINMSAVYFMEKLKASGIRENEIGLFYATPCAAKIAAIKSPVGEIKSPVTGVINMNFLYNRILKYLQNKRTDTGVHHTDDLTSKGILWSLTRGEVVHVSGRTLAIDGMKNVNEFLENIENEKFDTFDFLELRACDESCAGGILISGNRFLTVERLQKRALRYKDQETTQELKTKNDFQNIKINQFLDNIEPRPMGRLDENTAIALKKMERKHRLMCFLPGLDCGGCGAPDCETLSEDIVQGNALISQCVFMQQQMISQNLLSPDQARQINEDIWGGDRLGKDCNKIELEDENN